MGVQRSLLVNVVVLVLAGQSQRVLPVHPVVAGDDGVARDLVYRVAVVRVVVNRHCPPGVLPQTGGNVGKVKSEIFQIKILLSSHQLDMLLPQLVPEEPV